MRPHVGTQPHQYDTPVRLPSTGAARPEGLAARGRDAAHAVGPYQDQLGPPRQGRPAQQQPERKQRDGRRPLAGNGALADEQRADEKQALIAAAHREGGRRHPAKRSWMARAHSVFQHRHSPSQKRASPVGDADASQVNALAKHVSLARASDWNPRPSSPNDLVSSVRPERLPPFRSRHTSWDRSLGRPMLNARLPIASNRPLTVAAGRADTRYAWNGS